MYSSAGAVASLDGFGRFGVPPFVSRGASLYLGARPLNDKKPDFVKIVLGDIDSRFKEDPVTRSHSVAMPGMFASLLTLRLEMNPKAFTGFDRRNLSGMDFGTRAMLAAPHDIAKYYLADLVGKPGKFSPSDRDRIAIHPSFGAWLISQVFKEVFTFAGNDLWFEIHIRYMENITRFHHASAEYLATHPDCGEVERIAKVADILDALFQSRPYRAGIPIDLIPAQLLKDVQTGILDKATTDFAIKNWDAVAEILSIRKILEDNPGMDSAMEYLARAKTITDKWLNFLLEQEKRKKAEKGANGAKEFLDALSANLRGFVRGQK